jgi:ribonuclease R
LYINQSPTKVGDFFKFIKINKKNMKQQHKSQKQDQKLRDIGKLILRFMNKKASKIYNYKQIADGIEYKNPRQRELVIQALHKLKAEDKIKETEKINTL